MVIAVPTVAFVVTLLASTPTTQELRTCDRATVVILLSSGDEEGDVPAGDDTCADAGRRQGAFVGGVAVVGGAASIVAFRLRRPRGARPRPTEPALTGDAPVDRPPPTA